MRLFRTNEYVVSVSAKFARQRFLCSEEYSAGVCHGACCNGPSVVLLSGRENSALLSKDAGLPIYGQVMVVRGKKCPLSLPNGHCKFYGTEFRPFICTTLPFCLNDHKKLVIDNGFMKRACRVRQGVNGGQPAYRAFKMALQAIFGVSGAALITKHFDEGGGDITVPVSREVMEALVWHREAVNDINKFGYKETIKKLAGGMECL